MVIGALNSKDDGKWTNVDEVFRDLSEDDQDRFVKLLACEDTDLFVWMMEREVPADPDFQRMVRIILDRVQPSSG